MKAFILAAGLGTRLYPHTLDKPKALVGLNGKTLLERAINKVSELEISEIIVNIHHFGDKIVDFLKEKQNFHLPITISDERDQLLDTGGALIKAHQLLGDDEPFLLYNVDVLSTIDLASLYDFHQSNGGLATLAVRERVTDRYLVFDQNMKLAGWRNVKTGEEILCGGGQLLQNFAFCGIQIINPEIFPLITESGKFSLIQMYLRLAQNHSIYGYRDHSDTWMDLGKPDQLVKAETSLNISRLD
jgi:NDP-sugar pyrophosphorylase family protein